MRKLILGIFAVVCVQFAFVIYTALQSPLDVAVGPIFSEMIANRTAPDLAEPPQGTVVEEQEIEGPRSEPSPKSESPEQFQTERTVKPERAHRQVEKMSTVETIPGRTAEQFDTLRPADSADFETVVISYNRSPEISDCDKYEAPQPKKRSYIAKAAPVIKKPWEWIKSIGSKLN